MTLVDLDLTITIPPELKGVERYSVLIPLLFYEIQWLTRFQSFPRTLTTQHASPPMDGLDPFGTLPFYHMTLSCDLGLIHRARQGFMYQDFTTYEDNGSCPLGFLGAKTPKPIHSKLIRILYTGVS
jgi:hypothetical protein